MANIWRNYQKQIYYRFYESKFQTSRDILLSDFVLYRESIGYCYVLTSRFHVYNIIVLPDDEQDFLKLYQLFLEKGWLKKETV